MNLGTASVICANSRTLPLADNTVDLVVTSPPYFALRSYQDGGEHYAGQIGDEPTPAEFVASLLEVTRECVRVLKPSGSLWVNLGDKYAGAPSGPRQGMPDGATRKAEAHIFQTCNKVSHSTPQKSLIGIPWRYALACIDDLGLILRAEVIWAKPNGLPESVTDRVRRSHETWFHFTLEPRYFSAVDEIREAHLHGGHGTDWAGRKAAGNPTYSPDNGHVGAIGHDNRMTGNPLGKLPGSVWTVPTEPLRVPDHLGIDHFAAFPTEWPRRIIAGWSPAGVCVACGDGLVPVVAKEGGRPVARAHRHLPGYTDPAGEGVRDQSYRIEGYQCACPTSSTCSKTPADAKTQASTASARTTAPSIQTMQDPNAAAADHSPMRTRDATVPTRPAVVLDPFGGTGTTALVAKALGRHGITVDMSADYCRLAAWRTGDRNQLAKVLGVAKAEAPDVEQMDLFGEATA